MTPRLISKRSAQLAVVLFCAVAAKLYYSTAGVNQLRWILAPTAILVELVSGARFEFESHAGYMTSDRYFVIAASCAGVNFLITSFLMLSLGKLWRERAQEIAWRFIPYAALCAYLATLAANTVRITTALRLRRAPLEMSWLAPDQLHRLEGISVYFGSLLLLFIISEKIRPAVQVDSENASNLFRRTFCPLLFYYAMTLGIPAATGAYRRGADFWEHVFFVLLVPLALILPLATYRFYREQQIKRDRRGAVSAGSRVPVWAIGRRTRSGAS